LRDLIGDTLVAGREAAGVDEEAVTSTDELDQRRAPHVLAAEQVLDAVAAVGVRSLVELIETPPQVIGVADEPAVETAAEHVEERVRFERGRGHVRAGDLRTGPR
jgi:hypothetical protein